MTERYVPRHPIASASLAGVVEILITFPLENLKTQTQLQQHHAHDSAPRFRGTGQCFKETLRRKGPLGFYKGLTPWLVCAVPRNVTRFVAYEKCSGSISNFSGSSASSVAVNFASGLLAGMAEAVFVLTPMHAVQIKMIHDAQSESPRFRGFFHAAYEIPRKEGVLQGLWCGCSTTTMKAATTNAIRFGTFQPLSAFVQRKTGKSRLGVLLISLP